MSRYYLEDEHIPGRFGCRYYRAPFDRIVEVVIICLRVMRIVIRQRNGALRRKPLTDCRAYLLFHDDPGRAACPVPAQTASTDPA